MLVDNQVTDDLRYGLPIVLSLSLLIPNFLHIRYLNLVRSYFHSVLDNKDLSQPAAEPHVRFARFRPLRCPRDAAGRRRGDNRGNR